MGQIGVLAPSFCSLLCLVQSLWRVHKVLFRNATLTPVIISTWGQRSVCLSFLLGGGINFEKIWVTDSLYVSDIS